MMNKRTTNGMDLDKDVFGQEVWAYFQGKESYEVFERDDGFIGMTDGALGYFAGYEDWPEIEKQAIELARGNILDIGAGVGRNSLYLQKKGFDVTAIDNSPLAIKVCRKLGVKNAKVLPIEKINTLKPDLFDTVILFGNNFGLFGSYEKARTLLGKMHEITSPGALILAGSNDINKTDDPVHLAYHKSNIKKGRLPGQLRMRLRFKKYIGDWFDYLLVTQDQMKEILEDTGWRVRNFIDSDRSIYIAVIEKSEP